LVVGEVLGVLVPQQWRLLNIYASRVALEFLH
jgi:hypothetical protein